MSLGTEADGNLSQGQLYIKTLNTGSASVTKRCVAKALMLAVLLFLSESLTALHELATLSLKYSKQEKMHNLQQWVLVPHQVISESSTLPFRLAH